MFQFNFHVSDEEDNTQVLETGQSYSSTAADNRTGSSNEVDIQWFDAELVEFPEDILEHLDVCRYNYTDKPVRHIKICHLKATNAIENILFDEYEKTNDEKNCVNNLSMAERNHSDLVPGVYEGGAKIWECTDDLLDYLVQNFDSSYWSGRKVLDLGCGAGLLGIFVFLQGASVDFHDYNKEILQRITMPNLLLNECLPQFKREEAVTEVANNVTKIYQDLKDILQNIQKRVRFYAGDWQKWLNLTPQCEVYDIILTSETIYNPKNQHKLLDCLFTKLKKDGMVLLAAKTYYFGVGGDIEDFKKLIEDDKRFSCAKLWSSTNGVKREILELRKNSDGLS